MYVRGEDGSMNGYEMKIYVCQGRGMYGCGEGWSVRKETPWVMKKK